tara:strand:- start:1039 stop:1485 length:447 start_codon:yes stop_codon:yes gene_type:complete
VILISHRGNINGKEPTRENSPKYILEAMKLGYDVEVDVWQVDNDWYLGHDQPKYFVQESFLLTEGLWCHAKNLSALAGLLELPVRCFWHQEDDYTITSNGMIWAYPGKPLSANSICVMPERFAKQFEDLSKCEGVCSDFIIRYRGIND